MKKYKKLLLLLAWMIIIFIMSSFSAGKSDNQSNLIVDIILHFFKIKNIELIKLMVRKAAHFMEYFILGILAYNYLKDKNKNYKYAITLCIIYAISDELHQLLVPGRSFQIKDIVIDSIGSILGIMALKSLKPNKNLTK